MGGLPDEALAKSGVRALWAIQPQVDAVDSKVLGKQYFCSPRVGAQNLQKKGHVGSKRNSDHERLKDGSLPTQG
jgi:hypothetical protein